MSVPHARADPALVIRAEPSLRSLASDLRTVLIRRTGRAIEVGTGALNLGEVGLRRCGRNVCVRVQAPDRAFETQVRASEARPRTLAHVVQALMEEVPEEDILLGQILSAIDRAEVRPSAPPRPRRRRSAISITPRERPPRPWQASPAFFIRMLVGYEPAQGRALVGPGAGFGLCVGRGCVVVEADLGVIPTRQQVLGHELRYFSVTGALRFHLRPVEIGPVALAATFGVLTRLRRVSVDGLGSVSSTAFGLRMSAEASVRLYGPLEWVVEAGGDHILDSEALRLGTEGVHLENGFRPWVTMSLRVRPSP